MYPNFNSFSMGQFFNPGPAFGQFVNYQAPFAHHHNVYRPMPQAFHGHVAHNQVRYQYPAVSIQRPILGEYRAPMVPPTYQQMPAVSVPAAKPVTSTPTVKKSSVPHKVHTANSPLSDFEENAKFFNMTVDAYLKQMGRADLLSQLNKQEQKSKYVPLPGPAPAKRPVQTPAYERKVTPRSTVIPSPASSSISSIEDLAGGQAPLELPSFSDNIAPHADIRQNEDDTKTVWSTSELPLELRPLQPIESAIDQARRQATELSALNSTTTTSESSQENISTWLSSVLSSEPEPVPVPELSSDLPATVHATPSAAETVDSEKSLESSSTVLHSHEYLEAEYASYITDSVASESSTATTESSTPTTVVRQSPIAARPVIVLSDDDTIPKIPGLGGSAHFPTITSNGSMRLSGIPDPASESSTTVLSQSSLEDSEFDVVPVTTRQDNTLTTAAGLVMPATTPVRASELNRVDIDDTESTISNGSSIEDQADSVIVESDDDAVVIPGDPTNEIVNEALANGASNIETVPVTRRHGDTQTTAAGLVRAAFTPLRASGLRPVDIDSDNDDTISCGSSTSTRP